MTAPLYLDCDTGIDDALALAVLLRVGAHLACIGNVSAAVAARNTLHLLGLAERTDIPVAILRHSPLTGRSAALRRTCTARWGSEASWSLSHSRSLCRPRPSSSSSSSRTVTPADSTSSRSGR